jgi:formate hydrogenlyase subunit 6/NADH:ubiquinone oxidoreductase subunit I
VSLKHIFEARRSRSPIGIANPEYFGQQTGIVTLKYPYEALPVPDNGRYRLHNEMEDCIVCDKCAEICPVDCIEIEAVKSPEEIRKTSDGHSVRLYAAKFDIDMAKCCFCGLCTTVCPTECLTMTKTYDFSEFLLENMNYHFSDLSPAEAEVKRKAYEDFQAAKLAAKEATRKEKEAVVPESQPADAAADTPAVSPEPPAPAPAKPVVKRPVIKPVIKKPDPEA